ncbi:MAG: PQQ-dependent sugar dehydrogenase [Solirubrobacterales bacterium]
MTRTSDITRVLRWFGVLSCVACPAALGQTYDVAWTLGNVDFSAYRLDAFEPADSNLGTVGAQNPTLALELGRRYQVRVVNFASHPLEVIGKGASASADKVLLSTGSPVGTFESDPDVHWEDAGQGIVRFTLTTALYQAMVADGRVPGYRCRPHAPMMRGNFTVSGLPIAERIGKSSISVDVQTVASGLTAPVALVPDPGQVGRLMVVDQAGLIRVIEDGQLRAEPFLDVRDRLVQPLGILGKFDETDYDERGLLGFAFHPDVAKDGKPGFGRVYTYTSEPVQGPADFTVEGVAPMNHQSVVTEWQLTADRSRVDPASARVILRIDEPQFNHNGGDLVFGPDGYLYIGLGDGGGANDTDAGHGTIGNGQNTNVVLGKLLRIDPLPPELTPTSRDAVSANGAYRVPWDNYFVGIDGIDEIYAYGFRNPFRFSFDMLSGMLIVADVGQDHVEEINIVRKGGNYGWRLKEGTFLFDPTGAAVGLPLDDPNLIDPIAQYDHDDGLSIIGGYMYHGRLVPDLRSLYVFADFSRGFETPDGRLLVSDLLSGKIEELLIGAEQKPLNLFVKGMGQDLDGEVYILGSTALGPYGTTGVVLKIVGLPATP